MWVGEGNARSGPVRTPGTGRSWRATFIPPRTLALGPAWNPAPAAVFARAMPERPTVFDELRRRADASAARYRALRDPHRPCLAGIWRPPLTDGDGDGAAERFRVATYNVHRWAGMRGGRAFVPERAQAVLGALDADVIALQEVLLPDDDPALLARLAESLGMHLAFAAARRHKRGELGNAILARWPVVGAHVVDLSIGRFEQRAALAVEVKRAGGGGVTFVATHLALVDRTRRRQVEMLLTDPRIGSPTVLLGDMNAWRECRASRDLDGAFDHAHHNDAWPLTYPSARPVLALDRIYARGAAIEALGTASSAAARAASDHLPVVATVRLSAQD